MRKCYVDGQFMADCAKVMYNNARFVDSNSRIYIKCENFFHGIKMNHLAKVVGLATLNDKLYIHLIQDGFGETVHVFHVDVLQIEYDMVDEDAIDFNFGGGVENDPNATAEMPIGIFKPDVV